MAYFVKYTGYSTIRNGVSSHFVTIIADTAADIPEPQENWETGSELIVVENGGKKYILNNARTWVEVPNFTGAANSTPQNVEWVEEAESTTFCLNNAQNNNLRLFVKSIRVPEGVTELPMYAFGGYEKLVEIKLPSTLTIISAQAFGGCTSLTYLEVPSGVVTLTGGALTGVGLRELKIDAEAPVFAPGTFTGCGNLQKLTLLSKSVPTGGTNAGVLQAEYLNPTCTIYVPAESVDAYKAAEGWSDRASYIYPITD